MRSVLLVQRKLKQLGLEAKDILTFRRKAAEPFVLHRAISCSPMLLAEAIYDLGAITYADPLDPAIADLMQYVGRTDHPDHPPSSPFPLPLEQPPVDGWRGRRRGLSLLK